MALRGIKVIEMMGLAPGPLCGTILADFGASVTVVQKIDPTAYDVMSNGKRMISIDFKTKEGVDIMRKLCSSSDVILDTYRPGVMEKLGIDPKVVMNENPRLIYARLTGYGQDGFYKSKAGHDINYVAMSGVLSMLRRHNEAPVPPVNLLADFAGGSVLCALGIILALFERSNSGKGQVVDAGMTAGIAYVATWLFKSRHLPIWSGEPGTNILDGGLPCYGTYKTKDNKYMAVGALEYQFYQDFLKGLELSEDEFSQFDDAEKCKKKFEEIFLTKTQNEWIHVFEKLDACVTPVLDMDSIDKSKYYESNQSFFRDINNVIVPEPAPKLSLTPGVSVSHNPLPNAGEHTIEILKELGYSDIQIKELILKSCVYAKQKSNL